MTDKWRWILFVWHDWRAAVWWAEMRLYPIQSHGNLRSVPYRHQHAEAMHDFHRDRAHQLHRQLFPPVPLTQQEEDIMFRALRRAVRFVHPKVHGTE